MKLERNIKKSGNNIVMETSGIELTYDGKKIGKRTQIDEYDRKDIDQIRADLTKQRDGMQKAIDVAQANVKAHKAQFNAREKRKIEEFALLQGKVAAYGQYKKELEAIKQNQEGLKHVEKDLKDLEKL